MTFLQYLIGVSQLLKTLSSSTINLNISVHGIVLNDRDNTYKIYEIVYRVITIIISSVQDGWILCASCSMTSINDRQNYI